MKALKRWTLMAFAVLFLVSCSSSPQYADQEAHEKTEQLRQQYTALITGTWHMQYVKDKRRFFERLTFNEDGTMKGMRKMQSREVVTIDGKEQHTDWQDVDDMNGAFTGTWKLSWRRDTEGAFAGNRLLLSATFDDERNWPSPTAYSLDASFIDADESTLRIEGGIANNSDDGSTLYTRGQAEPEF